MNKRQLFLQHVAQTSDFPAGIEIAHASGVYIYDTNGKKYLDFDSGYSVSNIGHCHPKVVDAIQKQATNYMHTSVYGEHIQTPQVAYAEQLTGLLHESLNSVYYFNCGTESVEASIKLARKITNRFEIVACANAYHGSTLGAESLRSDLEYTQHFMPCVPGITHIGFNKIEELDRITNKTACIILEVVQAEAGVKVPHKGFLEALRKRCTETGTLLVLDEIQTGFGRTGSLFAHQKYGIIPDILLLAKAMGGGMPIGSLVTSKENMGHFTRSPMLGHITTFGGHPVCVAAALASLEVLIGGDIINAVEHKENYLRATLTHPLIKEMRSSGLLMAVELTYSSLVSVCVGKLLEAGVIVDYFLFNPSSFRIAPPLTITIEELALGVQTILETLDQLVQE